MSDSATLLKKRIRQSCFSVNFAKFLRTSFGRRPPDDFFLCLFVNFQKFLGTPLLYSTSEKLFFIQEREVLVAIRRSLFT